MNEKQKQAAMRRLSSREPKPEKKPMIFIDGKEFTYAKPADHSCYSCIHYIEEPAHRHASFGKSPEPFSEMPDNEEYIPTRYCAVTNSHNLRTWPFAHTVCEKWEHERAPQVEEEE